MPRFYTNPRPSVPTGESSPSTPRPVSVSRNGVIREDHEDGSTSRRAMSVEGAQEITDEAFGTTGSTVEPLG